MDSGSNGNHIITLFLFVQIQDGLGIFATRFDEPNLDTVFWIVVSCIGGLVAVVAILGRTVL